jgi:hypothetical protein
MGELEASLQLRDVEAELFRSGTVARVDVLQAACGGRRQTRRGS